MVRPARRRPAAGPRAAPRVRATSESPNRRASCRHRLPHVGREAEHRRQRGQLLIVQLQGVRQRQRVGDHVAVDERGPEVHVEHAQGPGAGRPRRACGSRDRDGSSRCARLPKQTASRRGGRGERRLVGLDPVPGDVLADRESGLAVGGQGDVDRPRRRRGVDLDGLGREAQEPESLQDLAAQGIVADPRDQPRVGTERTALIREVGGCAPELLAGRQQVPEHFAHGEDLMSHDRHDLSLDPSRGGWRRGPAPARAEGPRRRANRRRFVGRRGGPRQPQDTELSLT